MGGLLEEAAGGATELSASTIQWLPAVPAACWCAPEGNACDPKALADALVQTLLASGGASAGAGAGGGGGAKPERLLLTTSGLVELPAAASAVVEACASASKLCGVAIGLGAAAALCGWRASCWLAGGASRLKLWAASRACGQGPVWREERAARSARWRR